MNVGIRYEYCELNYHDQKTQRTLTQNIRKHLTAFSTLLALRRCIYRDLHHWRSTTDHRLQSRNLTTEQPIYIAHKWRQIELRGQLTWMRPLLKKENVDRNIWKHTGVD